MTTTINASPTNGLVQTADGSGVLKVQSNGVTTNALAWVNFAGATGTRNASYNVTSVTRNSTGNYTVNFASALTDANYTISCSAGAAGSIAIWANPYLNTALTTTTATVTCYQSGASYIDPSFFTVTIFGN